MRARVVVVAEQCADERNLRQARHTGHADIVRETVDGAQAVELVAAVEGWPENGFIKPWRKPAQD